MRSKTRRWRDLAAMLLVAVGVGADELAVVSTAPQGQLTGGEPGGSRSCSTADGPLSAAAVPGSRRTGSSSSAAAARWRWAAPRR